MCFCVKFGLQKRILNFLTLLSPIIDLLDSKLPQNAPIVYSKNWALRIFLQRRVERPEKQQNRPVLKKCTESTFSCSIRRNQLIAETLGIIILNLKSKNRVNVGINCLKLRCLLEYVPQTVIFTYYIFKRAQYCQRMLFVKVFRRFGS